MGEREFNTIDLKAYLDAGFYWFVKYYTSSDSSYTVRVRAFEFEAEALAFFPTVTNAALFSWFEDDEIIHELADGVDLLTVYID